MNDCELHIKTLIGANNFALVQITYNSDVDLTVKASLSNTIAGYNEGLSMKQYDQDGIHFDLLKDYSGKIYHIAFDINNYFSS